MDALWCVPTAIPIHFHSALLRIQALRVCKVMAVLACSMGWLKGLVVCSAGLDAGDETKPATSISCPVKGRSRHLLVDIIVVGICGVIANQQNRLNSLWFGDSANMNKLALETALAMAV